MTVPDISPVVVLILKPVGKPVAVYEDGELLAAIWYSKATKAVADAVEGLVITGEPDDAADTVPLITKSLPTVERLFKYHDPVPEAPQLIIRNVIVVPAATFCNEGTVASETDA